MAIRTQVTNPATLSEAAKRTLGSFFSDIDKLERGEIKPKETTTGPEETDRLKRFGIKGIGLHSEAINM